MLDRAETVAVGEPVKAVTRHAQELHRGAARIDELDAVEAELAVLLYEATGVDGRAGLGQVARRAVVRVGGRRRGHVRSAAPAEDHNPPRTPSSQGAPVLGARGRRALAAAAGADKGQKQQ